jgi:lysozyme family protein
MACTGLDRRRMLKLTAGVSLTGLCATSAAAQLGEIGQMLGEKLADKALKLLPAKPLNLARTVALILKFEKEADQRGLPLSPIAFKTGQPIAPLEGSLYGNAVPRLVTVIDRADGNDLALAEQAGELLADLNASQREVPEALKPAGAQPLSRSLDYATLRPEYAQLFQSAVVRPESAETASWYLSMMQKARGRYNSVGKSVGVPWYFIAAIHGLEASFNFRAHLHNGDFPLTLRTRQVPAGRPSIWLPPADWESSAKDALKLLGFANQSDWSLERTLYRLERYNGLGYRRRGVPSPYLWSFTNHYDRGKFVADGSFNPRARSQQCGAATMLKLLTDAGEIPEFAPVKPAQPIEAPKVEMPVDQPAAAPAPAEVLPPAPAEVLAPAPVDP